MAAKGVSKGWGHQIQVGKMHCGAQCGGEGLVTKPETCRPKGAPTGAAGAGWWTCRCLQGQGVEQPTFRMVPGVQRNTMQPKLRGH